MWSFRQKTVGEYTKREPLFISTPEGGIEYCSNLGLIPIKEWPGALRREYAEYLEAAATEAEATHGLLPRRISVKSYRDWMAGPVIDAGAEGRFVLAGHGGCHAVVAGPVLYETGTMYAVPSREEGASRLLRKSEVVGLFDTRADAELAVERYVEAWRRLSPGVVEAIQAAEQAQGERRQRAIEAALAKGVAA